MGFVKRSTKALLVLSMASPLLGYGAPAQGAGRGRKPRAAPPVVAVAAPVTAPAPMAAADGENEPIVLASGPSDPRLAPLPPPAHTVQGWADVTLALARRALDLKLALADVQRAEGQWRSALAATLPTIIATGQATHQFFTQAVTTAAPVGAGGDGARVPTSETIRLPTPDVLAGRVVVSQPLLAVAAWQNVGTAAVDEEAARLSVADTKRRLTQGILAALVAVDVAERLAEVNRTALAAALERVALVERRLQLGGGTVLDVVRTRLDANAARATLVTGDEAVRKAREALGLALGFPMQVGFAKDRKLEAFAADVERTCPAAELAERADLQAARRRLEVAERRVDHVALQAVPTLTAQAEASATTLDRVAYPPVLASVQAVLTVPIWDGGARYGARRVAESVSESAAQRLEATERQARVEAEQAERGVHLAEERAQLARATRDDAREAERLQRVAFHQGRSTSLELVLAAGVLRDAESALVVREIELVQARLQARLVRASCRW